MLLALTGPQMTTLIVVVSSVVALIVVAVVFKVVSRPVAGYHPPTETDQHAEPVPHAKAPEEAPRPEEMRGATKGFVLPLPSDTPSPTGFAPPSSPSAAKTAPPPVPRQDPVPPVPAVERTVDITSAVNAAPGFDIPNPSAPASSSARNLLIVRSGSRMGETFNLDSFPGGVCAIGRSDVAENQIVIRDDLKVSRVQHAIVTREQSGRYSIRDNNSANKVYVNDTCIDTAPVPLSKGDRIRIGLTEFEFAVEPNA